MRWAFVLLGRGNGSLCRVLAPKTRGQRLLPCALNPGARGHAESLVATPESPATASSPAGQTPEPQGSSSGLWREKARAELALSLAAVGSEGKAVQARFEGREWWRETEMQPWEGSGRSSSVRRAFEVERT